MEPTEQNLSKKERHELRRQEKLAGRNSTESKKRLSTIILWSFIVLFVGGTIALMVGLASKNSDVQFLVGAVKAADDSDQMKGAPLKEAKIILIEYSDFQCPACRSYYQIVKKLSQEFPDLSVVYRHFPLPQHANARTSAQAAEAAGQQGKFWEMHDMLFDNQQNWAESKTSREIFLGYALALGLDIEKFKTDYDSSATKIKIEKDYQSGAKDINGTPTFFINNKKIQNPRNYDEFRSTIEQVGRNS